MNRALGYKGTCHCKLAFSQHAELCGEVSSSPYSSQNLSGALMRGPLRMRLSLDGGNQPDH